MDALSWMIMEPILLLVLFVFSLTILFGAIASLLGLHD